MKETSEMLPNQTKRWGLPERYVYLGTEQKCCDGFNGYVEVVSTNCTADPAYGRCLCCSKMHRISENRAIPNPPLDKIMKEGGKITISILCFFLRIIIYPIEIAYLFIGEIRDKL